MSETLDNNKVHSNTADRPNDTTEYKPLTVAKEDKDAEVKDADKEKFDVTEAVDNTEKDSSETSITPEEIKQILGTPLTEENARILLWQNVKSVISMTPLSLGTLSVPELFHKSVDMLKWDQDLLESFIDKNIDDPTAWFRVIRFALEKMDQKNDSYYVDLINRVGIKDEFLIESCMEKIKDSNTLTNILTKFKTKRDWLSFYEKTFARFFPNNKYSTFSSLINKVNKRQNELRK